MKKLLISMISVFLLIQNGCYIDGCPEKDYKKVPLPTTQICNVFNNMKFILTDSSSKNLLDRGYIITDSIKIKDIHENSLSFFIDTTQNGKALRINWEVIFLCDSLQKHIGKDIDKNETLIYDYTLFIFYNQKNIPADTLYFKISKYVEDYRCAFIDILNLKMKANHNTSEEQSISLSPYSGIPKIIFTIKKSL